MSAYLNQNVMSVTNDSSTPTLNVHAPIFVPSPYRNFRITTREDIIIGHINICSLRNKVHVITKLITTYNIDILAVSETWLDNSVSDGEVDIPTTTLYRKDRPCPSQCSCKLASSPCRKGGGVCLYVRSCLPVTRLDKFSHPDLELLWVRYEASRGRRIIVGCLYRPPSQLTAYWEVLAEAIDTIDTEEAILMGDLNVDFFSEQSNAYKHLKNKILLPCSLRNTVKDATRLSPASQTSIDCILTNIDSAPVASAHDCEASDHRLVISSVAIGGKLAKDHRKPSTRTRRDFSHFDARAFNKTDSSAALSIHDTRIKSINQKAKESI